MPNPVAPARGILSSMPTETIQHHRWAPPEFLEDFIAHYWSVAWTLAEPHTAETIPHPCTHIILDQDEQTPLLQAVRSDVFTRTLEGSGAVLGVKFRPAMGFSLTRQPQNTRRNSSVSLHSILPELPRDLVQRRPLARSLPALEDALRRSLHPIESGQAALRDLLEGVASRPTHFTAASLARASGVSLRTLQRQCARFVGLSPKQIILRYRLIETAETLRRQPENLAAVAADLEYADQAHLTHTFRSFTGHTPSGFVEAAQSDQTPSPSD